LREGERRKKEDECRSELVHHGDDGSFGLLRIESI
jgi:hypothetical protein